MARLKQKDFVVVEWVDSTGMGGWQDYKPSNLGCTSVGVLVENGKDRIVLACGYTHNKNAYRWNDIHEIPRVAVKSIKRLK